MKFIKQIQIIPFVLVVFEAFLSFIQVKLEQLSTTKNY